MICSNKEKHAFTGMNYLNVCYKKNSNGVFPFNLHVA